MICPPRVTYRHVEIAIWAKIFGAYQRGKKRRRVKIVGGWGLNPPVILSTPSPVNAP